MAKTEKKTPKAKTPTKPSTVDSPVQVVRDTCEKMKGAARKDVMGALVAKGVNRWTAATQYQLWHSGKVPKAKAAAK